MKASKFVKDVYAVLYDKTVGGTMTLGQFAKVTEDLKKPTTSLWVLSCQVLLDLSITGWFLAMSLHCMGFAAGV